MPSENTKKLTAEATTETQLQTTSTEKPAQQTNGHDRYNIANFRIGDAAAGIAVKKLRSKIAMRRVKQFEFCRKHPTIESERIAIITDIKDSSGGFEGTSYMALPGIAQMYPQLVRHHIATPCITNDGTPFLWLIKDRGRDGKKSDSAISQQEAVNHALDHWISIEWDPGSKSFMTIFATANWPDPIWPDDLPTMTEWIVLAFGAARIIDDLDNEAHRNVLANLLGKTDAEIAR